MKLYGFWRSLATIRVRVALNLKGIKVEEIPVNLLKGEQRDQDYLCVNPQAVVPALVLDDGGPALGQSIAIIEYLDETHPTPPLLPKDPRGRARVRALSLICVADGHPLVVPRVRHYLEHELGLDEAARNKWLAHWTGAALKSLEGHLSIENATGRYCHGDSVTMADMCLVSQVVGAKFFNADTSAVPTVMRIFDECMKLEAFANAHPMKQHDAPAQSGH
jgi:maleylacetoacetate isomerase